MPVFNPPAVLSSGLTDSSFTIGALLILSGAMLLYAALHDFAARTIPNRVPAALLLIGLVLRVMTHTVLPGLACAFLVFAIGFFCWRRGWLGGGDVKLIAAVILVLPPWLCPGFVAAMALAGGILAVIYAVLAALVRRRPPPRPQWDVATAVPLWRRALCAERWRLSRGAPLPYATAIAAGFLFILFRG